MKSNYHTHHYLCGHATGNVEDYVLEAINNGFEEIGISDHGPIVAEAFKRMSLDEFDNIYLKEIDEAIRLYGEKIKIYKGLEIEFVSSDLNHYHKLLEKIDYLILGCHYYKDEEVLYSYSGYTIDTHEKLDSYTCLIEKALDSGLFKIIAHPDLFMYGYKEFDEFSAACTKRIIAAAINNNVLLEFNAGGVRTSKHINENGEEEYTVPNAEFWKLVSQTNAKVIVGSDCHKPNELADEAFIKAHELAKSYKLNIVQKLF